MVHGCAVHGPKGWNSGYAKAYHYGVDYWIQLQQLSPQVSDWEPYLTHQQYQQKVHQQHGRKWSFWERVSERGG